MDKKIEKIFNLISLIVFIITLVLSFVNSIFIPSCMLMLSLYLFSICYMIQEKKKTVMYILFVLGVLLIFGSLIYTYMRIV